MSELHAIKAGEIWDSLKKERALFWLINIYLFLEYVRPQSLYPALDVLPYSKIVLVATCVMLLLSSDVRYLKHSGNRFLGLFFLSVLTSSVLAISPDTAFDKMPDFIAWMIIYFLIITIVNTESRFLVFILAFLVYSFKMSQFSFKNWMLQGFAFSDWGTGGGPGWFHNSGEFGVQMCVFLGISTYFFVALKDRWPAWKKGVFLLFPFTALTGTISCASRGALLGAGSVLLWMLLKSRHKVKGVIVVALVAGLAIGLIPSEQIERFKQVGDDRTSLTRTDRWEKGLAMADRYPYFGVGYANWNLAERSMFGGEGGLSHNIFIECLSELGYVGLATFSLLILFTFFTNRQTRILASHSTADSRFLYFMANGFDSALVGYLVSGFFVTVLYYPFFWINLAMTVALNSIARNRAAAPAAAVFHRPAGVHTVEVRTG